MIQIITSTEHITTSPPLGVVSCAHVSFKSSFEKGLAAIYERMIELMSEFMLQQFPEGKHLINYSQRYFYWRNIDLLNKALVW
jgi:hypothetical protein